MKATATDRRPFEHIQHSDAYGKLILRYYGAEAWQDWLMTVSRCYEGERRINPVHAALLNPEEA